MRLAVYLTRGGHVPAVARRGAVTGVVWGGGSGGSWLFVRLARVQRSAVRFQPTGKAWPLEASGALAR
eukprot:826829-Prymnesium_polylepis.3